MSAPRIPALLKKSYVGFGMKLQERDESHPCSEDIDAGLAWEWWWEGVPTSSIHALYWLLREAHFSCLLNAAAAAAAKSLQSCPILCDPIDGSQPGSPVPGILQARTLEWVAISFSNAWKWKVKVKSLSHVWLFTTPWAAVHQAPPSMGFSRQEYWSGVPLPSPACCIAGE